MKRTRAVVLAGVILFPGVAAARTSLGTYDNWGAFRDESPLRCFAIAEPIRGGGGKWRPFASIATWPQAGARAQLHVRLSREVPAGAQVSLVVGDRRFPLVASGADAWAAAPMFDSAIVANLRAARSFAVEARSGRGSFSDSYGLRGAATAIDAAALGCARR